MRWAGLELFILYLHIVTRGVTPTRYKLEVMPGSDFDDEHRRFTLDS